MEWVIILGIILEVVEIGIIKILVDKMWYIPLAEVVQLLLQKEVRFVNQWLMMSDPLKVLQAKVFLQDKTLVNSTQDLLSEMLHQLK